jgi:hypothetical protein
MEVRVSSETSHSTGVTLQNKTVFKYRREEYIYNWMENRWGSLLYLGYVSRRNRRSFWHRRLRRPCSQKPLRWIIKSTGPVLVEIFQSFTELIVLLTETLPWYPCSSPLRYRPNFQIHALSCYETMHRGKFYSAFNNFTIRDPVMRF